MSRREQSAIPSKATVVRALLGVGLAVTCYALVGAEATLGALAGVAAVVAGASLYGILMLGGGSAPATGVLTRLLVGMLAKWAAMLLILVVAIGVLELPPVPVLAGVIAAMVAQMLALARR